MLASSWRLPGCSHSWRQVPAVHSDCLFTELNKLFMRRGEGESNEGKNKPGIDYAYCTLGFVPQCCSLSVQE